MKCENVNKSRGVFMLLALILLLAASFPSHEVQAAGSWQDVRPYKLPSYQLEREKRNLVTIYTGFTDAQISGVMDDQFDHVQYMMFVNMALTTADGKPKQDAATGEVQTKDDGC